jgi:hypothetical protein
VSRRRRIRAESFICPLAALALFRVSPFRTARIGGKSRLAQMPFNAMSELFPIIRRQRRPLIVEDVPPIPTKTEPVQSVMAAPLVESAESAPVVSPKRKKTREDATQN